MRLPSYRASDGHTITDQAGKSMINYEDLQALDDQAFLAERRRVRGELEHAPEHAISPELATRYQQLNDEFLRRARIAWTPAR
jgi:hypothetical protein